MSRTRRKHGKGPRSKCRIGCRYKNKLWSRKNTQLDDVFVSTTLEDERETLEEGEMPDNRETPEDNREATVDKREATEDSSKPLEDNSDTPEDNSEPSMDEIVSELNQSYLCSCKLYRFID